MSRTRSIFTALLFGLFGAWMFWPSDGPDPTRTERVLDVDSRGLEGVRRAQQRRLPPKPELPARVPERVTAVCPLPLSVPDGPAAIALGDGDFERATADVRGGLLHLEMPADSLAGTVRLSGFADAAVALVRTPDGHVGCAPIALIPQDLTAP